MFLLRGMRVLVLVFVISCAGLSETEMQRIPIGAWGGDHIRLEVGEKSASVEYDCAHGTIEGPLTVDSNGRFSLRGTHTPERGGPIRADEQPRAQPARFVGSVSGNKMTLILKLEGEEEETFTLEKGKEANLFKCK
jgi:hypothetical protein